MPKLVIPRSQLPPVNANQDAYFLRFRITTDDKNVISYWSNIFKIDANTVNVPGIPTVNHNSGIVTSAWLPVSGVINYDIWYRYSTTNDTGEWVYFGRTNQTSFVSAVPSGQNKFSIRVYQETQENNQNNQFLLYERLNVTV